MIMMGHMCSRNCDEGGLDIFGRRKRDRNGVRLGISGPQDSNSTSVSPVRKSSVTLCDDSTIDSQLELPCHMVRSKFEASHLDFLLSPRKDSKNARARLARSS